MFETVNFISLFFTLTIKNENNAFVFVHFQLNDTVLCIWYNPASISYIVPRARSILTVKNT